MTYDAQKHRKAFSNGAATYVSMKVKTWKFIRDRTIYAAMNNWPAYSRITHGSQDSIVAEIKDDPKFRASVGSIWLLIFGTVIEAIIRALLAYWFETKEKEGQG